MSDTPYFSIIVPMYNAERYVKICVNSILNQTFQDFEIIIVDDCSTDNSYKICTELYGKNKKIRLLRHEKNQGQGPARNTGIENARGEYICFVDDDDAIIPQALEKIHKATRAERGGADTLYLLGHYETHQDNGNPLDISKLTAHWTKKSPGFLCDNITQRLTENFIGNRIWFFPWRAIYKRKFLKEYKIEFPATTGEDHVFLLATMIFSKKYLLVGEAVYIWRVRETSTWHTLSLKNSINSIVNVAKNFERIMNSVPELADNRILKEKCLTESFECFFRDRLRPIYDGINIPIELDKAVYETLLPVFGENTTLVKYLFHGYNNMWRQAQVFANQRNYLAQQNYLLQQRINLITQQNNLISQINPSQQNNLLAQINNLLAQQNRQLEQMKNKKQ